MAEPCLWVVTVGKVFGINLSKLTKLEVVDWESISSPTFDFSLDLPAPEMCPFVLDSKIYMAAGVVGYDIFTGCCIPFHKIYEFEFDDIDGEKKQPRFSVAKSIPDAPVSFVEFFIANISGDVYFFAKPTPRTDAEASLYVLRSGSKDWKSLSLSPSFEECTVRECEMFVLHDKLFLASDVEGESYLASFDPGSNTWTEEYHGNNILDFFNLSVDGMLHFCLPNISVSVPRLSNSNCSVTLSWSYHEPQNISPRYTHSLLACIKISALLVNHRKGVLFHQHLDECFQGIQPTIICISRHRFILVDLGNNKLCALLYGRAVEHDFGDPVLCISVFTLSMAKDFIDTDTDAGAPPSKEQRFLSVSVHSKSVYTMKGKGYGAGQCPLHAFMCPPTKEGRFQHMT